MFFLLANKKRLVLHDVVQHLHWLLTRELLHQIVRSGKDSIATILGDGRYMLTDIRGVSHRLEKGASAADSRPGKKYLQEAFSTLETEI